MASKSSSEKNISSIGAQSPPNANSSKMSTPGAYNGITNDISTRDPNAQTTGVTSSNHNVIGIRNIQNTKIGKENISTFPNNSASSSNGLTNLNYNLDLSHHSQKQVIT